MKSKKIIYALPCLFAFIFLLLTDGSLSYAAQTKAPPVAQKAPEAKKPLVAQKQPKSSTKVAPRKDSAHLTKVESSAPAPRTQKAASAPKQAATGVATISLPGNDSIKIALDKFGQEHLTRMNKAAHKAAVKQPDGTYLARYMAYDTNSLETYYKAKDNKVIKYIGYMTYTEIEYVCSGKNQKEALAGPYNETNRTPVTELIKYKAGKWTN